MADNTPSIWGDFGGPLNSAFNDFTSSQTPDDIFSGNFLQNALQGTLAAAKKTSAQANPLGPATHNPYEEYFGREATIGNFEKGDSSRVGLESTKPARQSQPARSTSPQQTYLNWHNMMKTFAYGQ